MPMPRVVADVMTPHPYVIDEGAPLRQARSVMVEHDIHHLPVVRHKRLVGVLTDRDLKRALDPDLGLPPEDELFVRDVCVFDAYTVTGATPLAEVLTVMAERHIGSALVTDRERLIGILTASDACRILAGLLTTSEPAPVR